MKTNKTVEILYEAFLDEPPKAGDELGAALLQISGQVEEHMHSHTLTCEELGEYEYAAAHKAFYAGFYAALALYQPDAGAGAAT